jgi:hypothetical protein
MVPSWKRSLLNPRRPLVGPRARAPWALGPSRPGLGFGWGGGQPGPTPAAAALILPLAAALGLPWWRGKVKPLPTI